ncbi:phosphoenolpyruvate-protein phosphotransferase PtsI [Buchnera aphidicola]|uniref:phosphoenolpyruvate-protein phosphotransferase PtsI n=1 Tax=Buchnera aphidicola TaxID=9 RepID=UPI00223800A5|nr:phosphoenolpyruvate-protein phosphotransferase PtsI [Buchnera aphidicola (Stegophylla sp.)]
MISGILASPGIAIGKALLIKEKSINIYTYQIPPNHIDKEINKFLDAKKETINQLEKIKNKSKKFFKNKKENIFTSHIMILKDQELEKEIILSIKQQLNTAEHAVNLILSKQINYLNDIQDEYLKNRAIDIQDIRNRILRNLLKINTINLKEIQEKVILIAHDLTPSEIAQMNFKYILGFITELGGYTAHTAIMARSLSIPAIVGVTNILNQIKNNDCIILNAVNNQIIINPKQETINQIKIIQKKEYFKKQNLNKIKHLSPITLDNHKIEISANIGNINDLNYAQKYGAQSIGLYRTEFLFMERTKLPSEDEQFVSYKTIAQKMKNQSVTIRTLDIGGDKKIPYMHFKKEENPFLGWRAIRISLDKKEILYTQLRAILRASQFGRLRILFPMIISIEEIQTLKEEIKQIKQDLNKKRILFDSNIPIGIMIETPSSAIIAEHLIKEVDFFSIGTNDLTQYTLAVDRGNQLVSKLYNPFHPSVLSLIHKVIQISHKNGKWTGMCGELASNELATILLLGMGLDEFSTNPSSILKIKNIIRKVTLYDAKRITQQVLKQKNIYNIMKLIQQFMMLLKHNVTI